MRRMLAFVPVLVLTAASAMLFAQAPPREMPPPGVPTFATTAPIVSPTVAATLMVRTVDGAASVDLIVLWRGSNGWFLKQGGRSSGGGVRGGTQTARVRFECDQKIEAASAIQMMVERSCAMIVGK